MIPMSKYPLVRSLILGSLVIWVAASQAFADDPIRVACVGDSITLGRRVSAENAYPAQLQDLLGNKYAVKNFGRGGATLLKTGTPNVWQDLETVREYQPQIVIVLLGTNDTVGLPRKNWEQIERFPTDYADLVREICDWPTKPRLVICTPTASALATPGLAPERLAMLTERKGRLERLSQWVRELAEKNADKNVTLLELNGMLSDHPEWLQKGDGVHPNSDGYREIAKAAAAHLALLR